MLRRRNEGCFEAVHQSAYEELVRFLDAGSLGAMNDESEIGEWGGRSPSRPRNAIDVRLVSLAA